MMNCSSHEPSVAAPPTISMNKDYWRSLEELSDTPEFREWLEREFPNHASEWLGGSVSRRRFLQLMSASIGLAGLAGCRRPEYPILPFSKTPEAVVAGLPTQYATSIPRPGSAFPILVESHEGRPTKIEGNPLHRWSLGSSDLQAQAAILDLYDPDRSREVLLSGQPSSWEAFDQFADTHFKEFAERQGKGLHFLSGNISSPAMRMLREDVVRALPEAVWHVHEAIGDENRQFGNEMAFGKPYATEYRFETADVIVSLDCDFLGVEDGAVAMTRAFTERRKVEETSSTMNRLYVVENHPTTTGAMADHRLRLASAQVIEFALAMANELLTLAAQDQPLNQPATNFAEAIDGTRLPSGVPSAWVREVAHDLRASRGRSLILAGPSQPPLVHALAHLLNWELGNLGQTIVLRERPKVQNATLPALAEAIRRGAVGTLVMIGGNPAYDAPADLELDQLLPRVPHAIRVSESLDETSALSLWQLPMSHFLESWGDAETSDGTYSPIQPLIAPLFATRSPLEVVARLIRYETTEPYEIVQRSFVQRTGVGIGAFRKFLHDGVRPGSSWPAMSVVPDWTAVLQAVGERGDRAVAIGVNNLELAFHADRCLQDGRFANNGWLQETPDPITKLTWGNAAMISPLTAKKVGVETGEIVKLSIGGRTLEVPVFVLPGQVDFSISLPLGYGRTVVGRVGTGVGCNAYKMRTTAALWSSLGVTISKTGKTERLASTQNHGSMQGRDLVRTLTLADFQKLPTEEPHDHRHSLPLYKPAELEGQHQWGMVVDLNQCTGCSACVVACQSENNIPIVGKEEVLLGREMHWIRLDRYFTGTEDEPGFAHQPVACVHCENAPCETVCPVNATVHSPEGLNLQVYNRCIGTRYCANNCPYKVRRFNWLDYNEVPLVQLHLGPLAEHGMPETLKMQKNPDVTVRMRGVMEKCTYCVQRIERGKVGSKLKSPGSGDNNIPDGTIVSACAQACPAQAIRFGDLLDPNSQVSQAKKRNRDYDLLGELGTLPRTSYQGRVRNPNPLLAAIVAEEESKA